MDPIKQANFTNLAHAVSLDDHASVLFLLETGSDPNQHDADGNSALGIAVASRFQRCVAYLLEFGANPDLPDASGLSPTARAQQSGDASMAALLAGSVMVAQPVPAAARSTAPNRVTRSGWSTSKVALLYLIGASFAYGAYQLRLVFKDRASQAIVDAISSNDVTHVGQLLISGISPNAKDPDGNSILMNAATNGKGDIVRLLLENHADPNLGTPYGIAALKGAGIEHTEIIDNLLDAGADANRLDGSGRSLLSYACTSYRYARLISVLLKHRASPNVQGDNGPPLVSLLESGAGAAVNLETLHDLLGAGANPDAVDSARTPAIVWAADQGNQQIVAMLLTAGAKVKAADAIERTALHAACRDERKDIAEQLLAKGADPNAVDAEGNTPLMYAVTGVLEGLPGAEDSCLDVLKILKSHGADLGKPNHEGETPAGFARKHGITSVSSALDHSRQ